MAVDRVGAAVAFWLFPLHDAAHSERTALTEGLYSVRERRREGGVGVGVRQHVILRCPDWIDLSQVPNQFPLRLCSVLQCSPPRCLCLSVFLWSAGPRPNSRIRRKPLHLLLPFTAPNPFAIPPPSFRAANHNRPTIFQPNRFADQLMHPTTRPCISPGKARNPGSRNRVRG
jgi:hypothetical protein